MKITFSPSIDRPGQPGTEISVAGDTITVDDVAYDLSTVPEGGEAIPKGSGHPFRGKITRIDGEISCLIAVVLGDDAARHQPRDPAHWTVTVTEDGPVEIPALRKEEEQ